MNFDDLRKVWNYLGDFWDRFPDEQKNILLIYWYTLIRLVGDLYLKLFASDLALGLAFTPRRINYKWRKYQFIYEIDFKEDPEFLDKGRASSDMVTVGTKTKVGDVLRWEKIGEE